MKCKKCGNLVEYGINVCPKCGNIMPQENYQNVFSNKNSNFTPQVSQTDNNFDSLGPKLVIIEPGNKLRTVTLVSNKTYIGRISENSKCAIMLKSNVVSSVHGLITFSRGNYYYTDCNSRNGTYFNGKKMPSDDNASPILLNDGDVLSVGGFDNSNRVVMIFSAAKTDNTEWKMLVPRMSSELTIGRDTSSDICIPNVTVSRKHAVISVTPQNVIIKDYNSSNGTIIDGTIVTEAILSDLNIIMIGTAKIIYVNRIFLYRDVIDTKTKDSQISQNNVEQYAHIRNTNGFDVDIRDVSRIVKCKKGTGINGGSTKSILDHVSLTIKAGEFVAICGGSGAGKTTFMNCINGFEPATSGQVFVSGSDLYKNYSSLKNHIGYVPQQDIVHDNLTLESMLTYTAKLRLQSDITKEEIKKTVNSVLEMVDLTKEKNTFIKKLSGGQRKRASIAVELVSDPSLFFLDEPTSGLDPEAETHLMHRLQNLSREKGKTVIVITHTLQNIHLFDKIVFLAPGGKLCFYGSPNDAKLFFEVDNLADAYEKISQDIEGYVNKFNKSRMGIA